MGAKHRLAILSCMGLMSIMTVIPFAASAESKRQTNPVSTEPASKPKSAADGAPKPKPASANPALQPKPASTGATTTQTKTIVEVATEAGTFKTLTAALKAAGLDATLESQGPFTVFAPTDRAFADLPAGTVENLLRPENKDKLVKILSYHVVSGAVPSKSLKSGEVTTVQGSPINVKVGARSVIVNNAKVTSPDIQANNGVIHVIDRVILPPELTGTQAPTQKPAATGTAPKVKPGTAPAVAPAPKQEAAPAPKQ